MVAAGQPPEVGMGGAAGAPEAAGGAGGAPREEPSAGEAGLSATCVAPAADCDGSAQTPCESDVDWNARNCGACGSRCDGACLGGECGAEEPVLEESNALAFLSGDPYHYVLTSARQLLRIARATAEVTPLASELGDPDLDPPQGLVQAAGHFYVWNTTEPFLVDGHPVHRVPVSGGRVVSEPFLVESFGASNDGLYHVYDGVLWFRPAGEADQLRLPSSEPKILCSSPSFVLVQAASPAPTLYRANQEQLTPLGPAPDEIEQAGCVADLAVLLTGKPWARTVIRINAEGFDGGTPVIQSEDVLSESFLPLGNVFVSYINGFDLTFEVRGNVHVRSYVFGREAHISIGLPLNAVLVHRDGEYVWYNSFNSVEFMPQLKRAHYIERLF